MALILQTDYGPPSHRAQTMLKGGGKNEGDDDEDDMMDTEAASGPGGRGTLRKRAVDNIRTLRDFCDGMEYHLQFDDH